MKSDKPKGNKKDKSKDLETFSGVMVCVPKLNFKIMTVEEHEKTRNSAYDYLVP